MFTDNAEVVSLGLRYSNIAFAFSLVIALGLAYEKIFQSVGRMASTMFLHDVRLRRKHQSSTRL